VRPKPDGAENAGNAKDNTRLRPSAMRPANPDRRLRIKEENDSILGALNIGVLQHFGLKSKKNFP
jgi:hypothetical protein